MGTWYVTIGREPLEYSVPILNQVMQLLMLFTCGSGETEKRWSTQCCVRFYAHCKVP